jgi:Fe-S-cluster-containing hydrogenase component 2
MTAKKELIWIAKDLSKYNGCRKCEIAYSLFHENRIWLEASRIRVFILVPETDFPHFCTQCEDYQCVETYPVNALSTSKKTGAVRVKTKVCIACGKCIDACSSRILHMHPKENYVVICDLCKGDLQCVKVCQEGGWNVLKKISRRDRPYKLYARTPEEITRDLAFKMYGEKVEEFL